METCKEQYQTHSKHLHLSRLKLNLMRRLKPKAKSHNGRIFDWMSRIFDSESNGIQNWLYTSHNSRI